MYPINTRAKYNPGNLSATANTFTTVYLWNYVTWNYDEWVWSHPGVDIVPIAKNDVIHACLDWIVEFAWTSDANGNYVVIKHANAQDPSNPDSTTTLYSCHLHLSELDVSTWNPVKEWDVIWRTWNTWNSTWEHLHFQIDTHDAPFHPYWPFTFKDAMNAWLWFFDAVNKGLWIENARKYTINPLVYLDKVAQNKWQPTAPVATEVPKTFASKSKYFWDVVDDVEEIDFLYEAWVTKGYWDNTFRPESNITRYELLVMVYKFAWITPTWTGPAFQDVLPSDGCYKYISDASSKWFISWYADWTFKPNNTVTRAEAIAIALNIVVWKTNIPQANSSDFQDVAITDWYCKYANYVSENWLMDAIWKFYPSDNMKRKDFAVLLYNLKK